MRTKPDWKFAPEWAQYLAQDRCGVWYWHSERPQAAENNWISGGRRRVAEPHQVFWDYSLEERPAKN